MRTLLAVLVAVSFAWTIPACSSGGGSWKAPPGQVQKKTGYNPASGKVKGTPGPGKVKGAPVPGKGKIKIK